MVVNETLARTLWPGQNPLGQMITTDGGRRVVGVVADVRHTALETAGGPEMYLPMRQTGDYAAMQLVVRTALPPDSLAAGIRTALRPLDPNLPVREFVTFQDLVDKAVSPRRFLVLLLAGFAAFALLLASLGIYAVISYSVSQRVQEIGIRMALGASATHLQSRILLHTLGLAALGLALGMAGVASSDGRAGKLVVWCYPRRSGHIYRDRSAADCGGCSRWIFSRSESFANRSDGGIASELNGNEGARCFVT